MAALLDALEIDRAHVAGNSMGGRVALEMALTKPDRVDRVVLLSPAMAWLRPRRWAPVVRLLRPELSVLPMPVEGLVRRLVPGGDSGWAAAGVDEFLRSYSTPRGRVAFNAVAAQHLSRRAARGDRAVVTAERDRSTSRCSSGAGTTGSCRSRS